MERFWRSLREECVDGLILFGENALRQAVRQFVIHFHQERNHQGLKNRLIEAGKEVGRSDGKVRCRERLGVQELARGRWRTKRWQSLHGDKPGGRPFTRSTLYRLLTNVTYTGARPA
jgi:hypothetical protein